MAKEVVQYCLATLSALVTKRTYGNAVKEDGMCITLSATVYLLMWMLIVTDVRHTVIVIGLEIGLI
jgi:hypothetical protein